jgi:hypothetical protein
VGKVLRVKTDLSETNQSMLPKMNTTFTREYLQSLPAQHRQRAIDYAMDQLRRQIIDAATSGKAFHVVNISQHIHDPSKKGCAHQCGGIPPYYVTKDDLVEEFKKKFPDSHVEYVEMWEDTRPGIREQKNGILVNWS